MATTDSSKILGWLKAAGEVSRLRLLALCTQQDLSVSDLAQALGQSEPRVSRHLKILCAAGLLERLRQGQWVHYRLTQSSAAAWVRAGPVGAARPLRRGVCARPRSCCVATGRRIRCREREDARIAIGARFKGFVEAADVREKPGSALVVGVEHLELLETAATLLMSARHRAFATGGAERACIRGAARVLVSGVARSDP